MALTADLRHRTTVETQCRPTDDRCHHTAEDLTDVRRLPTAEADRLHRPIVVVDSAADARRLIARRVLRAAVAIRAVGSVAVAMSPVAAEVDSTEVGELVEAEDTVAEAPRTADAINSYNFFPGQHTPSFGTAFIFVPSTGSFNAEHNSEKQMLLTIKRR